MKTRRFRIPAVVLSQTSKVCDYPFQFELEIFETSFACVFHLFSLARIFSFRTWIQAKGVDATISLFAIFFRAPGVLVWIWALDTLASSAREMLHSNLSLAVTNFLRHFVTR